MSRHRTILAASVIAAALCSTSALAQTAQTQGSAIQPGIAESVMPAAFVMTASELIGVDAYAGPDAAASSVGKVTDLVISSNGAVAAIVVEVGGFLGIGAKAVAIPYGEVGWTERDGKLHAVVSAPADVLKELPDFDRATYMPSAAATLGMEAPGIAAETAVQPAAPELLTSENIVGASITAADGSTIGTVSDVILTQAGEVEAVIVDVGGFLGIGSKSVAVGFNQLMFATAGNGLMVLSSNLNKEMLEERRAYDPAAWATDREAIVGPAVR